MSALLDGGPKSRKFLLSIGTQVAILLAAILSSQVPAMVPLFDTLVGGLVGVLALYSGANIGAKHVLLKRGDSSVEVSPSPR